MDITQRAALDFSIMSGYRGSHAHGTTVDPEKDDKFGTDDIDLMDVCVLPRTHYLGFNTFGFGRGTVEIMDGPWDVVAYEVLKYINLCMKGNPNVLMLLWLDKYEKLTPEAHLLVSERVKFTRTKATVSSHFGYAMGQYQKMKKDPTSLAYMGERRKALAREFGYDVKNASHMIRLLRMLIGLLRTGDLLVDRTNIDAAELVSIKRGEWPLVTVLCEMEKLLKEARDLEAECDWPGQMDRAWVSNLSRQVIEATWRRRGE